MWHNFVLLIVTTKVIRHTNVEQEPCMHQNFKDTTTIVRSMDTEPLNADPSPHGHQAS